LTSTAGDASVLTNKTIEQRLRESFIHKNGFTEIEQVWKSW